MQIVLKALILGLLRRYCKYGNKKKKRLVYNKIWKNVIHFCINQVPINLINKEIERPFATLDNIIDAYDGQLTGH